MRYMRLGIYSGIITDIYLYLAFFIGGVLTNWDLDYISGVSLSTPFLWKPSFYLLFPDIVGMCLVGLFAHIIHGILAGFIVGVFMHIFHHFGFNEKVARVRHRAPMLGAALAAIKKLRYGENGLTTGIVLMIYVYSYEFVYPQSFSFATFAMPVLGVNPLSGYGGVLWYLISAIY